MRCVATGVELPKGSEAVVIRMVEMGAFGPSKDKEGAMLAVISSDFWERIKAFIDDPSQFDATQTDDSAKLEIEQLRKQVKDLESQAGKKGGVPDLPVVPAGAPTLTAADKEKLGGVKTPVEGVDIPSWNEKEADAKASSAMEKIQQAQRPFLDRLSPGLVNQLIDISDVVEYPHGRIILEEGQVGQALYVVVTGYAEVVKRGKDGRDTVIVLLGKGQVFGEISVMTGDPTAAAIRARGITRVMVIHKSRVDKLLMTNVEINRTFFMLLADRLRSTNMQMAQVSSSDLRGRLSMMGLVDLVQNLFQSKRTGTLNVEQGSQWIRIGFKTGQVQGVVFSSGEVGGHAFARALQWADGKFSFDEATVEQQGLVNMDTMSFLMDTLRIVDEQSRHK